MKATSLHFQNIPFLFLKYFRFPNCSTFYEITFFFLWEFTCNLVCLHFWKTHCAGCVYCMNSYLLGLFKTVNEGNWPNLHMTATSSPSWCVCVVFTRGSTHKTCSFFKKIELFFIGSIYNFFLLYLFYLSSLHSPLSNNIETKRGKIIYSWKITKFRDINGSVKTFVTHRMCFFQNNVKMRFHKSRKVAPCSAAPMWTTQNGVEWRKTVLVGTKKNWCSSMRKPVPLFACEHLKKKPKFRKNVVRG